MDSPASQHSHSQSEDSEESEIELNYGQPAIAAPEDAYFKSLQRPRIPQSIRAIGIILNSRRRTTTKDSIRGAATAWIDLDDSGTYDPKATRVTPPRRVKRARVTRNANDGAPKVRKPYRRVGYIQVLTFKFTQQKSLDYLRSITPATDSSNNSTEDEEFSDSFDPDDNDRGVGRKRRKSKPLKRLGVTTEREDGLTLEDLTNGHPQRRGCKSCFQMGDDECSLIEFGYEYPCTACGDMGIDCEYIAPPELKKSCEGCKRKRITCSFRDDGGKGVDICEACEEEEEPCCAGPLMKSSYARRFGESSPEPTMAAPASRMYVACNECRNSASRCSLKRDENGPCTRCRKQSRDCTFVLAPARGAPKSKKSKVPNRKTDFERKDRSGRKSTPPIQHRHRDQYTPNKMTRTLLTEAAGKYSKKNEKILRKGKRHLKKYGRHPSPKLISKTSGNQHMFIKTAFAHPIVFNYHPHPDGKSPCSWCASPFFGLWGHGEREIEVIQWGGATGNEEVEGGHAMEGKENSKMCITCTFARLRVTLCTGHQIRHIKDLDQRSFNLEALAESFSALTGNGDMKNGQLAVSTRWCSICVSLAQFECCAPQAFDGNGEPIVEGKPHTGCGLSLCLTCKELLGRLEGSRGARTQIMDELVKWRKSELWRFNKHRNTENWDWVRADAEFLTSSGELMVRMKQIEEKAEEKKDNSGDDEGEDIPEMFKKETLAMKGKGKKNVKGKNKGTGDSGPFGGPLQRSGLPNNSKPPQSLSSGVKSGKPSSIPSSGSRISLKPSANQQVSKSNLSKSGGYTEPSENQNASGSTQLKAGDSSKLNGNQQIASSSTKNSLFGAPVTPKNKIKLGRPLKSSGNQEKASNSTPRSLFGEDPSKPNETPSLRKTIINAAFPKPKTTRTKTSSAATPTSANPSSINRQPPNMTSLSTASSSSSAGPKTASRSLLPSPFGPPRNSLRKRKANSFLSSEKVVDNSEGEEDVWGL